VLNHKGDTVDQDIASSDAAEGTFLSGDVWVITRTFSLDATTDELAFVESYAWSDFKDTSGWAKGKTGTYTGIGRKFVNQIRYGNKYEPNTQTSGVSTFDFLDYKVMSDDHGYITAMRQAGNTLKVYFERNSAAVLVNKTQFYNADGTSQVLKSDLVLGDAVYSNYHYGTIYPESVYLKDRTVYFYDVYRDAFLQDSSNGIVPISDNKMKRYFREKSTAILTAGVGNVRVYTSYDYYLGAVVVLFDIGEDTDVNNCILYNDKLNRWSTFLNWELDDGREGMIFTVPTGQYLYTTPAMTLTSSFGGSGKYNSAIICNSSGTFNTTATFPGTDDIYLSEGAEITVTAYIQSGDAVMHGLLYMVITSPDGETVEAMDLHIGSGNTYTYTHTATKNGNFSVTFRMSGNTAVTALDYTTVLWYPSFDHVTHPIPGNAVSEMISINGEDVWIHNSNDTRNNFFGTQETSIIEVIGNEAANIKKTYEAMAIHSNKGWDVTEITIPADETYTDGMLSKLPEARFVKREGIYYSDYLRNQYTNGSVASTLDLVRGEQLRGYYIRHRMENSDTSEVVLFKVDVLGNVSRV
jgi:hypothetical protein